AWCQAAGSPVHVGGRLKANEALPTSFSQEQHLQEFWRGHTSFGPQPRLGKTPLLANGSLVLELMLGGGEKNGPRRFDKALFGTRESCSRTGCLSDPAGPGD